VFLLRLETHLRSQTQWHWSYLTNQLGFQVIPLAACDAAAERYLILDVGRYKCRPAWATASELFNAMNTTDADAGDKTRGFALVSKTGS
jgi:hypothetical protein